MNSIAHTLKPRLFGSTNGKKQTPRSSPLRRRLNLAVGGSVTTAGGVVAAMLIYYGTLNEWRENIDRRVDSHEERLDRMERTQHDMAADISWIRGYLEREHSQ